MIILRPCLGVAFSTLLFSLPLNPDLSLQGCPLESSSPTPFHACSNLELGSAMSLTHSRTEEMFLHLGLMRSSPVRRVEPVLTHLVLFTVFGPALEFSASLNVIFTLQEGLGPAHTAQCTKPLLPPFYLSFLPGILPQQPPPATLHGELPELKK